VSKEKLRCPKHPEVELICPVCVGAKGGKRTAKKYAHKKVEWGAMGGRPRKQPEGSRA